MVNNDSSITASRLEIDYRARGNRIILVHVTDQDKGHCYRTEPSPEAFRQACEKLVDNASHETPMKFMVDEWGFLLEDDKGGGNIEDSGGVVEVRALSDTTGTEASSQPPPKKKPRTKSQAKTKSRTKSKPKKKPRTQQKPQSKKK